MPNSVIDICLSLNISTPNGVLLCPEWDRVGVVGRSGSQPAQHPTAPWPHWLHRLSQALSALWDDLGFSKWHPSPLIWLYHQAALAQKPSNEKFQSHLISKNREEIVEYIQLITDTMFTLRHIWLANFSSVSSARKKYKGPMSFK